MEFMRSWIISVTVSAMIIAIAEGMMPSGTVKKIGKLTGGLVLMLGILQPIVRMDYEELFQAANGLSDITLEAQSVQQEGNEEMMKSIIEEELSAYVLDKAQSLGISCKVSIRCVVGEGAVSVPEEAEVRGCLSSEDQRQMERVLSEDLGIMKEKQTYINEEVS